MIAYRSLDISLNMGFLSLHQIQAIKKIGLSFTDLLKSLNKENKEEGYIEVNITKHIACEDQTFLSRSLFKPCTYTKISSLSNASRMTFKGDF